MPAPDSKQVVLAIARESVEKTARHFRLDSTNIRTVKKNLYSDKITISPTFFATNSRSRQLEALLLDSTKGLSRHQLRKKRENELYTEEAFDQSFNMRTQDHIDAKIFAEYSVGNCGELAFFAAIMVKELGYTGAVECIEFKKYDHIFVVLNRPKNSDPSDPSTWGEDTIILEPWLKTSFSAKDFENFWLNNIDLISFKDDVKRNDRKTQIDDLKTTDLGTQITFKAKYFSRLYSSGEKHTTGYTHANIVRDLSADDAFRFLRYLNNLYGREYIQKSVLTPENRLKMLQGLSYTNYNTFMEEKFCIDSYKEKYIANTATGLEVLLFALTTNDITLLSASRLKDALQNYGSKLDDECREGVGHLITLLSELEKNQDHSLTCSNVIDIIMNATTGRFFCPQNLCFDNANLENKNMKDIQLPNCSFKDADLSYAILEGSNLSGSNLTGINFKCANLSNASFRGATLIGANFREVNVTNTNFYNAQFLKKTAFTDKNAFTDALNELLINTNLNYQTESLNIAIATEIDVEINKINNTNPDLANELRQIVVNHYLFSSCLTDEMKALIKYDDFSHDDLDFLI